MSLVSLLISIAVAVLVCGFLCWLVWTFMPDAVPGNWKKGIVILFVAITVICIVYFILQALGLLGAVSGVRVPNLGKN